MDALQFAYWLNGFAELHEQPPTPEQWDAIKAHLGLVFNKVTPPLRELRPVVTPPLRAGDNAGDVPWWLRQAQCAAGDPNALKPRAECLAGGSDTV
ncbi:MAG: hypothetical protein ABW043_16785 [Devosia sp.]|uniref:hypothetical protein n=1 Tax=Devosia sp. TaxID=1871048 RepID=UPI00339B7278